MVITHIKRIAAAGGVSLLLGACEKPTGHSDARSQKRHSHEADTHGRSKSHGHEHGKGHAAGHAAGVLALDVYSDGTTLHLLTVETQSTAVALIYRKSEDHGEIWSSGIRVDEGMPPAHSPRRGMDPQIAASGKNIVAAWMSPGTDEWGGGPIATALSHDGGRTWRKGPNPADDGSTAGHGFIDVAAKGERFHLTWLDTRNNQRGLRYAASTDAGQIWSANVTVDPETCECCANAIVPGLESTVAILYRDKSPRDMRVGLSSDGGTTWKTTPAAGAFGWQFDGCPHAGGGLAFGGANSSLFATVWTGHSEQTGLYFTVTTDSAATWSSPVLIDKAAVHSDLATNAQGRLAIVWASARDSRGSIWAKTSPDAGKTWSAETRLSTGPSDATHPRVAAAGEAFRVFWTETDEAGTATWKSAPVSP